jgi:hypothetical protein
MDSQIHTVGKNYSFWLSATLRASLRRKEMIILSTLFGTTKARALIRVSLISRVV